MIDIRLTEQILSKTLLFRVSLLAVLLFANIAYADDIIVRNEDSLRESLRSLKSGDTLKIASGDYAGAYYVKEVDRLTVEALDPKNPPHFKGGSSGWHFSRCNDLVLRYLQISGQSDNGLNLDDGGQFDQPVKGITVEHLTISDIGPQGNHDGIKCSGLDKLTIRNCTISGWGGQGIDLVGCHDSLISSCSFVGKPNFTATAGVQTKGGCSDITVEKCHFAHGGERPINVGGSTDLRFFRPSGAKYEARRIVVRDNTIEGSSCAAAFVGVDGAEFIGNEILYPEKWIFRILQETTAEGFNPCRNVLVKENRIIFRRAQVQIEINIGNGTDPKSFQFDSNQWFAEDRPESSKPRLPNEEKEGVYGIDPRSADDSGESGPFSIATFVAEVTPPIGHPLQAGLGVQPVVDIADPLLAHGFVLQSSGPPVVLCSVDWCGIGNDAHDRWREVLADAAGTTRERVLVTAIHQHDAPLVDLEAERLISGQKIGRYLLDTKYHEEAVQSVATALKASLDKTQTVTHIGLGQAKVDRIASTRRILGADGKVEFVRGSASKEPRARTDPEGTIDPWLKTISFWNSDQPLASISVYATHPMSYYGLGHVSADFTGLARRRRQADDPGVLHFYANGCGGDLAPGKYNDGTPVHRVDLAERLYQGWKSAWGQTKKHELQSMKVQSIPLRLVPKESLGFTVSELEAILTGANSSFEERVRVAFALSWRKRCDAGRMLDLPVLDFGVAQLLLLPGEPFVEYQLFAQQQRPDSFVMTLGYGDYGPVYIPTDRAFDEGGYEPGAWSFVAPGVEKSLKDAIQKALMP